MSTDLARKLRRDPPEPERRMWAILFPLRRQGYNFRRQAQIGAYYADFACRHPAMVIEVDGRNARHRPGAVQRRGPVMIISSDAATAC